MFSDIQVFSDFKNSAAYFVLGFYVIEDFGWSCLNRDVCEGHEFGFQKFANILHDMHGGENKAKFRGTYSPNFHIDQIRSIKSYRNFVVIEKV